MTSIIQISFHGNSITEVDEPTAKLILERRALGHCDFCDTELRVIGEPNTGSLPTQGGKIIVGEMACQSCLKEVIRQR